MNILDKYQEYATASTDAPSVYHKYIGAVMVGTVMGKRLWYQHGHQVLFPNLWVCLVGPSTWSKKSTSMLAAEYLISKVNRELIYPAKVTVEKLYSILANKASGVMQYGELHSLLSQFTRDYNAELKSTMTDLYDSPPYRAYDSKGGGLVEVQYPAVSIMAGSTVDWLAEAAKSKDICAGFYPRWLFVVAEGSDRPDMPNPPPRDEVKANALIQSLAECSTNFKYERHESGQMTFTKAAEAANSSIYGTYRREYGSDPIRGPFSGRALICLRKLGMIHAWASRRTTIVDVEDIEYGYEMVKLSMESISHLVRFEMGDTRSDQKMNKILKLVVDAAEPGIKRRDLYLKSGVARREYFDDLLKMLVDTERVVCTEPDERKKVVVYAKEFWKDPSDWEE